jgi:hypothetical protein
MEFWTLVAAALEQPQWVSRWKLNRRLRNLVQAIHPATTATIVRDTVFCQSIQRRYPRFP